MTKYIILSTLSVLSIFSSGQTIKNDSIDGLTIDSSIKKEVEKHISSSEFSIIDEQMHIYNNRMIIDLYENDELIISTKIHDNKSSVFKSFYYWQGDTLRIDGAFGLYEGTGFSIKIINGKASLFLLLASGEFPAYAYHENDSLVYRLEVPCFDTKIILSEIPDSIKEQEIFGYVKFKSDEYFASNGLVEGKEILPRKRQRANMKIYFKSRKIDL